MAVARIGSISLDCSDPEPLASFWASLLGGEIAFTSDTFVAVKAGALWLSVVHVPDYRAPDWPDSSVPKQIHLDLAVDDLEVAEAEALRLGAVSGVEQPAPDRWRVMIDPAGHPFCLTTQIPE